MTGRGGHAPLRACAGALALTAVLVAAGGSPAAAAAVRRETLAMGTRLVVEADAVDRPTALEATEAALRAVEAVEARLSTWREDSELARLNRSPAGTWFELSPELERDLREAEHWWRETGGSFDPGVAALVAVWDLRGAGREPEATVLAAARTSAGLGLLELAGGRARRLAAGFGIEEGGFGKGVALREAAVAAVAAGARCVRLDLGGQLHSAGTCSARTAAVAHPADRQRAVAGISLRTGSLATSGNSERGLLVGGRLLGHLLDPATGRPVEDWGSVTVQAADPVMADCLATALYVMGSERGLRWAGARPEVAVLFAVLEGEDVVLRATPNVSWPDLQLGAVVADLREEQRAHP